MHRGLNILQVSSSDIGGGSEKVAATLFQNYRSRGHQSWLVVGRKLTDDARVITIPNDARRTPWARFWIKAGERVETRPPGRSNKLPALLSRGCRVVGQPRRKLTALSGWEDFDFPGSRELLKLIPVRPDIVHGHSLHGGFFDPRVLPFISQQVPVVMTIHDEWMLTGHCAYSFDCQRWASGCGHCPDLSIYPPIHRDATAENWKRKEEIYRRSRLYLATPSRWLMDKVNRSMLRPAMIESRIIPYGVDLSVFSPGSKDAARGKLGLPLDSFLVLFVAHKGRRNQFKDYATIEQAVLKVAAETKRGNLLFLCVGEGEARRDSSHDSNHEMIRLVAYQKDPTVLADYYRAADVFVHAARADNFPNTILEAMACGTPVIATDVGGISEQIAEDKTGFLVPPGDSAGIAERLKLLLNDAARQARLGSNAAEEARARFDLERQTDDYLAWYQDILERRQDSLPGA